MASVGNDEKHTISTPATRGGRSQELMDAISKSITKNATDGTVVQFDLGTSFEEGNSRHIKRFSHSILNNSNDEGMGDMASFASGVSAKTLPSVSSVGTQQIEHLLRLRTPGTYFPPTPGTTIKPLKSVKIPNRRPRLKLSFPSHTVGRKGGKEGGESITSRIRTLAENVLTPPKAGSVPEKNDDGKMLQSTTGNITGIDGGVGKENENYFSSRQNATREDDGNTKDNAWNEVGMEKELERAAKLLKQERAVGRKKLQETFQQVSQVKHQAQSYKSRLHDVRQQNQALTEKYASLQSKFKRIGEEEEGGEVHNDEGNVAQEGGGVVRQSTRALASLESAYGNNGASTTGEILGTSQRLPEEGGASMSPSYSFRKGGEGDYHSMSLGIDLDDDAEEKNWKMTLGEKSSSKKGGDDKSEKLANELAVHALRQRLKDMERQLAESRTIAARRASALSGFESKFAQIQCDMKRKIAGLEREVTESRKASHELKSEVGRLRKNRQHHGGVEAAAGEGGGAYPSNVKELRRLQLSAEASQHEAEHRAKEAARKLKDAEGEKERLLRKVEALENERAALKQIQRSETSISKAVRGKLQAEAEKDKLRDEADTLRHANQKLRSTIGELEGKMVQLQAKTTETERKFQQVSQAELGARQAKEEAEAVLAKNVELESEKRRLEYEVREQRLKIVGLEARIHATEEARQQQQQQQASSMIASPMSQQLVGEMLRLQNELEQQRSECRRLRSLSGGGGSSSAAAAATAIATAAATPENRDQAGNDRKNLTDITRVQVVHPQHQHPLQVKVLEPLQFPTSPRQTETQTISTSPSVAAVAAPAAGRDGGGEASAPPVTAIYPPTQETFSSRQRQQTGDEKRGGGGLTSTKSMKTNASPGDGAATLPLASSSSPPLGSSSSSSLSLPLPSPSSSSSPMPATKILQEFKEHIQKTLERLRRGYDKDGKGLREAGAKGGGGGGVQLQHAQRPEGKQGGDEKTADTARAQKNGMDDPNAMERPIKLSNIETEAKKKKKKEEEEVEDEQRLHQQQKGEKSLIYIEKDQAVADLGERAKEEGEGLRQVPPAAASSPPPASAAAAGGGGGKQEQKLKAQDFGMVVSDNDTKIPHQVLMRAIDLAAKNAALEALSRRDMIDASKSKKQQPSSSSSSSSVSWLHHATAAAAVSNRPINLKLNLRLNEKACMRIGQFVASKSGRMEPEITPYKKQLKAALTPAPAEAKRPAAITMKAADEGGRGERDDGARATALTVSSDLKEEEGGMRGTSSMTAPTGPPSSTGVRGSMKTEHPKPTAKTTVAGKKKTAADGAKKRKKRKKKKQVTSLATNAMRAKVERARPKSGTRSRSRTRRGSVVSTRSTIMPRHHNASSASSSSMPLSAVISDRRTEDMLKGAERLLNGEAGPRTKAKPVSGRGRSQGRNWMP